MTDDQRQEYLEQHRAHLEAGKPHPGCIWCGESDGAEEMEDDEEEEWDETSP